jgi:serine/threonine protein kinase
MLDLLEHVHSKEFLHRDIKPANFAIGYKDQEHIYLLDFGLGRRYLNSRTKEHIPYKDNRSMTGTVRYASINTHLGMKQSRRDDIEVLLYVLVYFGKGSLPWQDIKETEKRLKYMKIMEVKMSVPPEMLCKDLSSTSPFNS